MSPEASGAWVVLAIPVCVVCWVLASTFPVQSAFVVLVFFSILIFCARIEPPALKVILCVFMVCAWLVVLL